MVVVSEDVPPGTVFSLSKGLLQSLMDDKIRGDMVVLSRFAIGVDPARFKQSPIWGDTHTKEIKHDGVDAFGKKFEKERTERRANNSDYTPW